MFSGNSLSNKTWIYEARDHFADLFDSVYVQDYEHWQSGENWIDLDHEIKVLAANQSKFEGEYGVFAKSIGTVLAVHAMAQGIIKPAWLLFCGLPLGFVQKEYPQFAEVAASQQSPVTFIHNEHDEVGTAAAAQTYLDPAFAGRQDYRFVATPGDNHRYEDYDLLRTELIRLRG